MMLLLALVALGSELSGALAADFGQEGLQADPPAVISVYETACEAGNELGCMLASVDRVGHLDAADVSASLVDLCGDELPEACLVLGWASSQSKAGVFDTEAPGADRARGYFQAACSGGVARGCADLALSVERGIGGIAEPERAAGQYAELCEAGVHIACRRLATLKLRGAGVERDGTGALALLSSSCEAGHLASCNGLGLQLHLGIGVSQDLARAIELYNRACAGGSPDACNNREKLYARGLNWPDAGERRSAYAEACGAGVTVACFQLATDAEEREPTDRKLAAETYASLCAAGLASGCAGQGALLAASNTNPELAVQLLEKGCNAELGRACGLLGTMQQAGEGTTRSTESAAASFEAGCSYEDGESCFALAELVKKGRGVTRDKERASGLYFRACNLGTEPACAKAK